MAANLYLVPRPGAGPAIRSAGHPIRVVLADDHTLMRRSLRRLLDREPDVEVVAEARDLRAVARQARDHLPNVLVLDLRLASGSSIEAVLRLREEAPMTQIVVLTMEDNPAFAIQALDAGAIGFVVKDFADTELSEAIRSAADGREYLSPRVAARVNSVRRAGARGSSRPSPTPQFQRPRKC